MDSYFAEKLATRQGGWRRVVGLAIAAGARGSGAIRECLRECKQSGAIRECLRARADSAAAPRRVARSYRRARMPANLVQAQRDYFGSHTYERTDMGGWHHTLWSDGNSADSITTTAYNN